MAVNQQRRTSLKRLRADLDELSRFPVAGISAAPLEDDMFEWHCNILLFDVPQHLIMFFPEEYPYKAPSAELTGDFIYGYGAYQPGKKGTQICMPLFSDFSHMHSEWEKERGLGWCPGYTVQTCLLNTLSFLSENEIKHNEKNAKSAEAYCCPDCGHSFETPYPPIHTNDSIKTNPNTEHHAPSTTHLLQPCSTPSNRSLTTRTSELIQSTSKPKLCRTTSELRHAASKTRLRRSRSVTVPREGSRLTKAEYSNELLDKLTDLSHKFQITDYISKDKFRPQMIANSNNDIFGYGLEITKNDSQKRVTSPYEFLTADSFLSMKESSGYVQSMMKRELSHFLPLFLCSNHVSGIKDIFEQTVKEISISVFPDQSPDITINEHILNMIPVLMWNSEPLASDACILGYFAIHRLFLWAVNTYPGLQEMVDTRLHAFICKPDGRLKKTCPDLCGLLMLLAVSRKYRWRDLAEPYMLEFWRRQTTEYVTHDANLGILNRCNYAWVRSFRLRKTRYATHKIRKQLALQVRIVDIAMPRGMSRDDVIARYDENLGFPTDVMITEVKNTMKKINDCSWRFADWFTLLKLTPPSNRELFQILKDALHFCLDNDDYNLSRDECPMGWRKASELYKAALESGKMSKWGM